MRHFPWIGLIAIFLIPPACSPEGGPPQPPAGQTQIRVLLLEQVDRAELTADHPRFSLEAQVAPNVLPLSGAFAATVSLASDGWHLGRELLPAGTLTLHPGTMEPMRINDVAYRGWFRFVPVGGGKFDVINDVSVEDYLKGVVTEEMYADWPMEALKAQAVASRTYALYQAWLPGVSAQRPWDVYADQRSQMYGGISGETRQSRGAVQATAGLVLTYGPGSGKIFQAYFSSCCGGVTQAASDAFPGQPYIRPLSEQSDGSCCAGSKYFNWGPITISKSELARRFQLWAQRKSEELGRPMAEKNITGIAQIAVQGVNRYGRPNRVLVTDVRGVQYSWAAEDLRLAANTDAPPGSTLPSSFCKIRSNSDSVTFYDGHGYGHGVGMCQWCAQARAAAGQSFEQILAQAYPDAKLVQIH